MFKGKGAEREKILARLEQLAQKVKLQYHGARGVEISVYAAAATGDSYNIEFAKHGVFRRVTVDGFTVQRMMIGPADPSLVRELRTALLTVIARAREKDKW